MGMGGALRPRGGDVGGPRPAQQPNPTCATVERGATVSMAAGSPLSRLREWWPQERRHRVETNSPFVQLTSEPEIELAPGVWARLVAGERGMLSFVRFEAGGVVPDHEHHHEQFGTMLDGQMF